MHIYSAQLSGTVKITQVEGRLSDHSLSAVKANLRLQRGDEVLCGLSQVLCFRNHNKRAANIPMVQGLSKHLAAQLQQLALWLLETPADYANSVFVDLLVLGVG